MISPSLASATSETVYSCGPVELRLAFEDAALRDALHGLLSQYDAPWPQCASSVRVVIARGVSPIPASEISGTYLHSSRLRVDRQGTRLISLSNVGVWMEFDTEAGQSRIMAPFHSDWPALLEEIEQQLVLLLARAWAQAGWTPLHAGSLVPPGENRCVLLCAPSGAGKTTLIAALLRRGWRTLGDDKTLLRNEPGGVVARALARRFHLHPASARWFPDAGDISAWPRYSRWTDKRVVRIEEMWPGRLLDSAIPAGAVQLARIENGLVVEPLDRLNTLNTLLRQVAIPADAEHARPLVSCIAATVANVNSALMKIGNEAFADPSVADRLDEALRRLLP